MRVRFRSTHKTRGKHPVKEYYRFDPERLMIVPTWPTWIGRTA